LSTEVANWFGVSGGEEDVGSKLYQFQVDGDAGEQVREAFPDTQLGELPPGLIVRRLLVADHLPTRPPRRRSEAEPHW
jgi:hypothetical protein